MILYVVQADETTFFEVKDLNLAFVPNASQKRPTPARTAASKPKCSDGSPVGHLKTSSSVYPAGTP